MIYNVRVSVSDDVLDKEIIRDNYNWHKKVWEMFPSLPSGHERPFLFKVKYLEEGCELVVVSAIEPSMPEWVGEWQMLSHDGNYRVGEKFYFDLLANPTARNKSRDCWGGRGRLDGKHRRFPISSTDERRDWLVRKAESGGFSVDPKLNIGRRNDFRFSIEGRPHGLHVGVRFRGTLTVTDLAKFSDVVRKGIGPAKGFGFGLLLLSPVVETAAA